MSNRKTFRTLLTLLLIMGISANGIMAEACLCGGACPHGLQNNVEKRVSAAFHKRCSETSCKSCSLENGWTFKATTFSIANGNLKNLHTTSILSIPMIDHSSAVAHNTFGAPIYGFQGYQSSPPYLQNLVLLL